MQTMILWALVAFYLLTGLIISVAPEFFYATGPGVAATGPYNMHFLRDVGFAFTLSALGLAYGLRYEIKPLVLFGASWLVVHGIFHFVLWLLHDQPGSSNALLDVALVVLPAAVLAYLAISYKPGSAD